MKVLVAGRFGPGALEGSYVRAFRSLGLEVVPWDVPAAIERHTRLARFGSRLHAFFPVEAWITKANWDFVVSVLESRPDVILVGGQNHIRAGALGQIRASLPECRVVLIWPDALVQCGSHVIDCLPLYDLVATYGRSTVGPLTRMGARRVEWVPLGFDPELHPPNLPVADRERAIYECDVSFIGGYRLERERLIAHLIDHGFRVKVWGPSSWREGARNRRLLARYWQGRALIGEEFCKAAKSGRLCLNSIDSASYPAANMRFFEILGCGGVLVSSVCPELEGEFADGEACLYYRNGADVTEVVGRALGDAACRERVAKTGQARVLASHTYAHRAKHILALLAALD